MDDLISSSYNNFAISKRESDGWVNLTQMCKANGKLLGHFLALKSTKAYISSMAADTGNVVSKFIEVVKGGDCRLQGSWGHPKIAEKLAAWIEVSALNRKGDSFEKFHQNNLAKMLNGDVEVVTKTGRIDVLTDTEIIEVKDVQAWKSAIGQVLVYQLEFPDRQPRIHLFGKCSQDFKQMVISYSAKLNVVATFSG
jgi:hypothetical protein